eukprot:760819-Hanusia_phi.AAC.3
MILNDFLHQWPDWFPQHLRDKGSGASSTPCRAPCSEESDSLDAMHIDDGGLKKNLLQDMERDVEEETGEEMVSYDVPLQLSSRPKDAGQLLVL